MSPEGARQRVLVVDDDPDGLATVLDILELSGYEAVGACNGREALQRLASGELPDLILLDLMMPVMNGWQFREEQRRSPRLADIPVVITSADRDAQRVAKDLGAAALLTKPMAVKNLLATVGRCIRAPRKGP